MKTLHTLRCAPLSSSSNPPYVYRIVPHSSAAVAAISSDDCLRALTLSDLRTITEGKHEGVTCLQPGPAEEKGEGRVLLTAGRKGDVKLWDGRDKEGRTIVKPNGE